MGGPTTTDEKEMLHVHSHLRHLHSTVLVGKMVVVSPLSLQELGTLDDNLGQLDALAGAELLGDRVDSSTQPEG